MAGFIQDPIQFINLIADNLRDRYQSGFPVLKELVQNTDDAEAAELHVGRSRGLPGAEHRLLRGPALFLVNNGCFSPDDARGIRSFGQNTKAADASSIGKFGLGMKSVFHFCEAFFFLAHDGARSYAEVLNPWSGSESEASLHADWDAFADADASAIRAHLAPVADQLGVSPERLFMLWLPLRQKAHLKLQDGAQAGAIVSEYPGDDPALLGFLDEADLPVRLAALMPMLRHLEAFAFWDLGRPEGAAAPRFQVRLDDGAKRLALLDNRSESVGAASSQPSPNPLSGRVRVSQGASKLALGFSGLEGYAWNRALEAMHGHELWPSSYVRDRNGHSREAKDKARPHATLFFSRGPGQGRLITNWSVFLPLDEESVEVVHCDGDYDFRLTLHGYFFVDAGRKEVHGLDGCEGRSPELFENEESLRRSWNCELLRSTVLPLLLPALEAFCTDERLADKAKTALSEALRSTSVFRRFREPITIPSSWLREITPDGITWARRDADRTVLSLPAPPDKDLARPWRLFPALRAIVRDHRLAVSGAPNLLNPSVEAQWQEEQLLALFASADAKLVFSEATLLDYLDSFLTESAGPYLNTQSVQQAIAGFLRKGLVGNGEGGLRQNEARVQRIVGHLQPECCFRIANDLPSPLLQGLLSADTEVLPLPERFFPGKAPGDAPLSVTAAARLLTRVEEALSAAGDTNKGIQGAALKLSEQLIKGVSPSARAQLLQRCEELRVLAGTDCSQGRRVPVSVHEIRAARAAGTLFGSGEARAPLGLGMELQRVLPHERVLIINKETAYLALDAEGAIRACDQHAVLRCLGLRSRVLGGVTERARLAEVAHVPSGDQEIRGLRFLLHANPEHFDDDAKLWVLGRQQSPVWQKLWAQLVGGAATPWNLLDGSIADALSRREWDALDIHEISAQSVLDEIEKRGVNALTPSAFSRDECEQILKEVRDGDDDLWRSLPFHWTRNGTPVSGAADNAYFDLGRVDVPQAMLAGVDLIERSDEPTLRQRQSRALQPLDEEAAIRIALRLSGAPDRWRVILDALVALDRQGKEPCPTLQADINTTKWLPVGNGDVTAPGDVIDLDAAAEEVDRILTREPGAFVTPRTLAPAIGDHPFFPKLQTEYFARGRDGLERLAVALVGLDDYQIGHIQFDDAKELEVAAQVLGEHPNAGWQLLSTLIGRMGAEDCFEALLSGMQGAVPAEAVVDLLNWIAERGSTDTNVVRVFNRNLAVLAREQQESATLLGRLKLLNQQSQWQPSTTLVSGVTGIALGSVLDVDQAHILASVIVQNRPGADSPGEARAVEHATETSSAGPILRGYLEPWTGRVASPLLGLFILAFGDDPSVKGLCQDLLGQHSRDWLIDQVPWDCPRSDPSATRKAWLEGLTLEQALKHFWMAVRVHEGETLSVRSIVGKPVKVALDEQFSTLFVGRPNYFRLSDGDGYRVELVLRRIATEACSDRQLSDYLLASTAYLLREVFNQHRSNLETLWTELGTSDQVDIELAKALMLDNIPFYLKQLGTHQNPALSDALKCFHEAERQEKEFGKQPKAEQYRRKKEQALGRLQQLIETDERAQQAILDSVQRKIRDFQYQPESIPFELFQNADDALRNLELIHAYPAQPGDLGVDDLPAGLRRFVIEADRNQITFMHWGRAINQFGSQGFPGRERGFDRDLENMLILSASDKGEDVTGKFGLGFKSVWLASDQPTIVSGRLQAIIVGGILPVPSHGRITQGLMSRLAQRQPDKRYAGTAIHLPLRPGVQEDTVIDRFCSVAGTMVAFSRALRTVEVQRSDGKLFSASWEPRVLHGIEDIRIGRLHLRDGDRLLAMKVVLGEGALLLVVGPSGFVELPKAIPSLWVTAPIREQERLGFAVNAMFEVDAGRSRLSAEVTQNEALARRLGKQLAVQLECLRAAVSEHWDALSGAMELADGVESYVFWHSLWAVLLARLPQLEKDSGARILATALLSEGLRDLAETHAIVPNGLPEGFQRLVRSGEAKTVLKGALANGAILEAVAKAACFKSLLSVECAVVADVATWLRLLIPSLAQRTDRLRSIALKDLVLQLDRRRAITPDDANALGAVLQNETLERWEKAGDEIASETLKDFNEASEKARDLPFLAASGSAKSCRQLVTDRGSDEEKRRWGFAPDNDRLSPQYSDQGAAFFLWCREKLEAPAERLKDWVILAGEEDRRQAALRYLVEGELADKVVAALHVKGFAGTWLAAIDEESELLADWDSNSRLLLIYNRLKTPEENKAAHQAAEFQTAHADPEPIEPGPALERIYAWWTQERLEHLERYRRKIYPEGRLPNLKDDDAGNIDRSSWLLVLLLGGFHTMGGVRPEQHRDFIESCQRRNWWTVFTDPNPAERFEDWMGVLDQYIDQQVDQQEYEQWMMRFPIIYKLSRHLDDYAELLLGLDRHRKRFDLAAVLQPWADPDQQGGGIGAAALPRTLGIGANFVVRELIRLEVIDSPHLREHAFVPYRRVRRLMAEMGCTAAESTEPRLSISPFISAFLHEHLDAEQVSFCGDFDVPLRIVAHDWMLQEELLGRALRADDFGLGR